nr:adenylate/guanylate cyclase domain-containing protein [Hyphomicrobiales bacterium]
MENDRVERKLAAILAADVVGYSRLMGADDEGTLGDLNRHRRELVDPCIAQHRGRIVKTTGDGLLAQFASVVDAVRCAVEIQSGMDRRNSGVAADKRLDFRIGVNVGDIVEQAGDIFGDGVNIAARLEGISDPGGICVSQRVKEDTFGKIDFAFEDIGEQNLKNIARPIRAYRLRPDALVTSMRPSLSLPDKPSIAVLPFLNMSGDQDQDYFSDGITEDIITALSKLRWFFVISRNSTFAYKGKAPDVRQVARDLGVRYVLEGSVRKAGDRLRVTAQLIDATTGTHIWAERYDRAVADIFAVQDEISENVVASIEPQLYAAENLRFESKAPDSLDAWGYLMRAIPHLFTWSPTDNEKAVMFLERAMSLDPGYARASSMLAWAYAARAHMGTGDPTGEVDTALGIARKAVEQDWEDPWAHVAVGYVYMVSRRFNPAVEEFREAIERNPSFAFAHALLGCEYGYGGMPEEGLRHMALAARLSPRDIQQAVHLSSTGLCHLVARRFAESAAFGRRAVQLRPHFSTAWRTLATAAGLEGDLE